MLIIYRILGFFINLIGFFIAISLVVIVPIFIATPLLWLPMFLIIAVVLYTWFSHKFRQKVLIRHEVVPHSLRDWVRVNGFVSIVFVMLNIPSLINLIYNPASYSEATEEFAKQFGQAAGQGFTIEKISILITVMLLYFVALFVHILWTFALIKKNKDFFQ